MTIPSLKRSSGEQETIAALKKAYSSLSQGLMMSENVNGPLARWKLQGDQEKYFDMYFAPFFNVVKRCNQDNECWGGGVKYTNGSAYEEGYYKVILADGSRMATLAQQGSHIHIIYDLNGAKPPNMLGTDVFLFTITGTPLKESGLHDIPDGGLYFYGHGMDRATALANCKSQGMECGALIAMDGWKISKDYP